MTAWKAFVNSLTRELASISRSPWDMTMLMTVPCLVIVLFGSMFYHGKAHHLPIAVIDEDKSALSQTIVHHIRHNQTVHIALNLQNVSEAHHAINRLQIGGYIHIPKDAQTHLVRGENTGIDIVYNQSFFSIGSGASSALSSSAKAGIGDFIKTQHLPHLFPHTNHLPHIKFSVLFNPNLSYELFLEPMLVPAILHLLLCCLVAFAIGQEFKQHTHHSWLGNRPISALLGKISIYLGVICLWTWVWLAWLVNVRGWNIAGSVAGVLLAQFLLYLAYALFGAMVALKTKDANKSFGILAIYGGSSMSFAGVSLPVNNAPRFTQIWSEIIPFTSFARLQVEQWVIGSPLGVSLPNVGILLIFIIIFGGVSGILAKKAAANVH